MRHSISQAMLAGTSKWDSPAETVGQISPSDDTSMFLPVFRSGSCCEKGPKQAMEDEHICVDNLQKHLGETKDFDSSGAFYGVFDGHGGVDATTFTRKNMLRFIVEDSHFPTQAEERDPSFSW